MEVTREPKSVTTGAPELLTSVKRFAWIIGLAVLWGCGGGGVGDNPANGFGEVAGNITDSDGGPVRGARVFYKDKSTEVSTLSNSSGAYVLLDVPLGEVVIQAEVIQGGVRYLGGNTTTIFENERSKSVNIAVVEESQLASIYGKVFDEGGGVVEGARVFAHGGALSSSIAITDKDGEYRLGGLEAGRTYAVSASARGFSSDLGSLALSPLESRNVDFLLLDATTSRVPVPTGLSAVVWTSPSEVSRSREEDQALEAVKRIVDPRRSQRKATSRDSNGGNPIEVDLVWDAMASPELLGFGIYRGTSATGATAAVDFLRDPEASFYADIERSLREGQTYYYEITALSTTYPNGAGSESDFSDRYGVRPIGDMTLIGADGTTPILKWQAARGAESYRVFVFDRYPSIGVGSVWSNSSTPTTDTQIAYGGPRDPGARYYWVVVGSANGGDSLTISRIGQFTVN